MNSNLDLGSDFTRYELKSQGGEDLPSSGITVGDSGLGSDFTRYELKSPGGKDLPSSCITVVDSGLGSDFTRYELKSPGGEDLPSSCITVVDSGLQELMLESKEWRKIRSSGKEHKFFPKTDIHGDVQERSVICSGGDKLSDRMECTLKSLGVKDSDWGKDDLGLVAGFGLKSEFRSRRVVRLTSILGDLSPITLQDEYREMKQKVELLWNRAMDCNRRKDVLHLLLSYPMRHEADHADFLVLLKKLVKINRIINRGYAAMEGAEFGKLMESKFAVALATDFEDVESCLDKYGFQMNLYHARVTRLPGNGRQGEFLRVIRPEERCWVIDSAIRQVLQCIRGGQVKVIGISGIVGKLRAGTVSKALEDLPELRSMFDVVISIFVSRHHSICEVQTRIAEEIQRLLGTDISVPLDEPLKPYKFVLFLYCQAKQIDLHDLKIPDHGYVVLTALNLSTNVYQIMPVDLEVSIGDHLLPWTLFWENVLHVGSPGIDQVALQLIEECQGHLLAIILLARALGGVTDIRVWKLALQELRSSSKLSSPVGGTTEVMVCVLGFVWERKSIVTRRCIKRCISIIKDGRLEISSLVSCWIENHLIETRRRGKKVLQDLINSFLLEKVDRFYVRMHEETRCVLLDNFIPHLDHLHLNREGLGLSEAPEVAEWEAMELINLNNNEISELPPRPNCTFLVKLLLGKNYNLMEIPPLFFECMPMLRVLDMSYTSIKSLPPSISRLVSLEKFLLRGCELLMELPPEIGALLNLQVLDLEGSELMNLPREIGKLTKLECLKVSFYGYGNSYRESKQITERIPRGLLSDLASLKELSIDVNPDDEEWLADVADFILDLNEWQGLTTLKLYLPKIKLLDAIKYVPYFKFTVGLHKQRVISCLPHAVEEEFEKQKNYLRYINGNYIPTEIKNVLKCTSAFFLDRHWTIKKLSEFGNENMAGLKFCLLVECNELQLITDGRELCTEGDGRCDLGIDKKPVLGSLEYLGIYCMVNLRCIWEGPIQKGCLSRLKSLALHDCPNLTAFFTQSLLGNLDNLEELVVEDCPKINSLVTRESSGFKSGQFLPRLKKISLLDLPELVNISSGLSIAPKLERVLIYACPKLGSLSPREFSVYSLEVIKGEIEWWDSLVWPENKWSREQRYYMAAIFVELKRDASLMDQLAECGNSA